MNDFKDNQITAGVTDALDLDKDTRASKKFSLNLFSFFCLLFFSFSFHWLYIKKKKKIKRKNHDHKFWLVDWL